MITEQYLMELSPNQRAALETLLAEQLTDAAHYAPRNAATWTLEDVLDLEDRGLLEYDPQVGTRVTAAGQRLVIDLAHDDWTSGRPALPRRVRPAERIAELGEQPSGRHALPDGAESTLPSLGVVLPAADLPRHERTEVIPAVAAEPEWPTEEGELDLAPVFAAFDADEQTGFIDTFPEAAVEHTAELEAIAAARTWWRRATTWVRVNATPARAAYVAATGGAFFGSLVTWAVTR